MEKKYQVFISSTYTDLIEARAKVRDAILSMYHFPVGMELFGATNEEQWEIIRETIDSSDYYVLIVGQRYGSIIPSGVDAGISYTEKEFRYALEKGIPVLAFIIDDTVPVKPEHMEKVYLEELTAFKTSVKTGRLVEWWINPDDLAQKVTAALYKQFGRSKRPGWIRGDSIDIEKSLQTITELTERNQKLIDENKALLGENQRLKQKTERKPQLFISIAAEDPDEEEKDDPLYSRQECISTDDNERIHLKVGSISTEAVRAEYQPISKADFVGGLSNYITSEEIEEYNKSLPTKDVLEAYLEQYKIYHTIQDHGIATVVTIHNIGTAKATDVSVTIELPEEIHVLDIEEVRKMSEPEAPTKPEDLQEIAYMRAHEAEFALGEMYSSFNPIDSMVPFKWPHLSAISAGNSIYESVEVFDNTVEIETKRGIVHTKFDWFGGIYLVPLKRGEFKAKVTLMCAEYEDPEETELIFVCE